MLNAARIESTNGDFDYYTEGITPTMSLILEAMDRERVKVAEALGFRAMSAREWLYIAYDAAGRTLYEAMRANRGYDGIKAPKTVYTRYISEDIPMSLVPIASLGQLVGVPTPTIDSIILLGSILHGIDYWAEGRTAESLGLAGKSLKEIRQFILDGETDKKGESNARKLSSQERSATAFMSRAWRGFLRSRSSWDYETVFLGAAVSVDEFVQAIRGHDPDDRWCKLQADSRGWGLSRNTRLQMIPRSALFPIR